MAPFLYLIKRKLSRNSDRAEGTYLEYDELDIRIPIPYRPWHIKWLKKWLFQCRIEDIHLNIYRKWNNALGSCMKGKNEIISYIPKWRFVYRWHRRSSTYIRRIWKENQALLKAKMTMWTGYFSPCSTVICQILQILINNKTMNMPTTNCV